MKIKQEKDHAAQMIQEKCARLNKMADEIEENNEELADDIDLFQFESNKDQLQARKQNHGRVQSILERMEMQTNAKVWSSDELEFFSVRFS